MTSANRDLKRIIDETHKILIEARAKANSITGLNPNYNPNHPINWNDKQYLAFAERWISHFATITQFRDNNLLRLDTEHCRSLLLKLNTYEEWFLQSCVRYDIQRKYIDVWIKHTPEDRYQQKKRYTSDHECSVAKRYGNFYSTPDQPGCSLAGCVPECRYYATTGTIDDDEVTLWHQNEIGYYTYAELKDENATLLNAIIRAMREQANTLPANYTIPEDYECSILHNDS